MSTPPTDARHHGALDNPETAHEHSDINVRAVLWFVATLVVVAALVHVSMYGLMVVFEHQAAKNDPFVTPLARPSGTLPPDPRLQTTPHVDLRLFVAAEDQIGVVPGEAVQGHRGPSAAVQGVVAGRSEHGILERTGVQEVSLGGDAGNREDQRAAAGYRNRRPRR